MNAKIVAVLAAAGCLVAGGVWLTSQRPSPTPNPSVAKSESPGKAPAQEKAQQPAERFDPARPSKATESKRAEIEQIGKKAIYSEDAEKRLVGALSHGDQDVRGHACWGLGRMAPKTKAAIPDLVKALGDVAWPVRHNAAWALRRFPGATEHLRRAISDTDVRRRVGAATTLLQLGTEATATVEKILVAAWDEAEPPVRAQVLSGLGQLRPATAPSIELLTAAVASNDTMYQKTALAGLSAHGKAAVGAVPVVVKLLGHKKKRIRMAAALALGEIGQGSKVAVEALVSLLADKKDRPAFAAAAALARLGALDALEKAQLSPSKRTRANVIEGVNATRQLQARHVQILIRGLKDPDWQVRLAAAGALQGRRDKTVAAAVKALEGAVMDKHRAVSEQALASLSGIAPGAAVAVSKRLEKQRKKDRGSKK